MNNNALKFFADYIQKELGIVYVDANYFQLDHRLRQIATQLEIESVEALYEKGQAGITGQFRSLLLDIATNNETSFFRDPNIYKVFEDVVIPSLKKSFPDSREFSIWCAASSSGQEPYSIAMQYDSVKEQDSTLPPLSIFSSDVSDAILARAEKGVYSQLEVQRGLPARNLIKYFDKRDGDQWEVKSSLRDKMKFSKINLLHDFGMIGPFDVVFCRNVLIYQPVENKKKILQKISQKIKKDGFLILGAAESLFGLTDDFSNVQSASTIVYQKK